MRSTVRRVEEKKPMNPIWRGLGCLLFVAMFIASFATAIWFMNAVTDRENPLVIPGTIGRVLPGAFRQMNAQFGDMVPYFGRVGKYIPAAILALVIAMIFFGLLTAFYSLFRGNVNDPRDARDFEAHGRRKRNVRKCR
jgi:hypothetical protein